MDGEPPTKQRRLDSSGRLEPLLASQPSGADPQQSTTTSSLPSLASVPTHTHAFAAPTTTIPGPPLPPASAAAGQLLVPSPASSYTPISVTEGGPTRRASENGVGLESEHWDSWKSHVSAEKERLALLEQGHQERQSRLQEWEDRLQDWEGKTKETERKMQQQVEEAAEVVKRQLVARTQAERALARKKLAEDCIRLGQASFERRGLELHEVWQDGELFRQLDEQARALSARREQLEATKKQLSKKRQSIGTSGEGADLTPPSGGLGDSEEICKVRILALKREEALLQEERERLNGLKMLHMKELKRVMDEDQSRFNNFPLLHREGRYLMLSLLGKGGFSEVYRAFDLKDLREVACKIHSVNPMWSSTKRQNYTKHAVREYMIHKELVHPKVVRLYDVFEIDANSFCTVLEYCEGGDLDSYLKQNKVLSEREAKCIISQIFSGLRYPPNTPPPSPSAFAPSLTPTDI